jgi:hypothetical protein
MEGFSMIGKTISHYRILDKHSQEGTGEVHWAKDRKLGRYVAIKVLPEFVAGIDIRTTLSEAVPNIASAKTAACPSCQSEIRRRFRRSAEQAGRSWLIRFPSRFRIHGQNTKSSGISHE